MGQQQLLLVILVTIIVGIATVVAINVFGTSAASANEDAVRQDILTIASASQGWYIKPTMMGGGGNSFNGIDFTKFNFSASTIVEGTPTQAANMNGSYEITETTDDYMTVEAHPASDDAYTGSEDTFANDASDVMTAMVCQSDVAWDGDDCTTS